MNDGEFMPFPNDYDVAAKELDIVGTSRVNPVFINDGVETMAVTGCNLETGEVHLANPSVLGPQETWTTTLEALWDDWVNGELTYRRREFLRVEEDTYDTEREAAVDRLDLAMAIDEAAGNLPYLDGEHADELEDALRSLRGALE